VGHPPTGPHPHSTTSWPSYRRPSRHANRQPYLHRPSGGDDRGQVQPCAARPTPGPPRSGLFDDDSPTTTSTAVANLATPPQPPLRCLKTPVNLRVPAHGLLHCRVLYLCELATRCTAERLNFDPTRGPQAPHRLTRTTVLPSPPPCWLHSAAMLVRRRYQHSAEAAPCPTQLLPGAPLHHPAVALQLAPNYVTYIGRSRCAAATAPVPWRPQPPCSCHAAFSTAAKQLPCSRFAPATADTAPFRGSSAAPQLRAPRLLSCCQSCAATTPCSAPTRDCSHYLDIGCQQGEPHRATLHAPCTWRRVAPTPAVPWQPAPRHRLRASCHQLHNSHYYLVTAVNREPHCATYVMALHAPFS
jgi:hypothetical protein